MRAEEDLFFTIFRAVRDDAAADHFFAFFAESQVGNDSITDVVEFFVGVAVRAYLAAVEKNEIAAPAAEQGEAMVVHGESEVADIIRAIFLPVQDQGVGPVFIAAVQGDGPAPAVGAEPRHEILEGEGAVFNAVDQEAVPFLFLLDVQAPALAIGAEPGT